MDSERSGSAGSNAACNSRNDAAAGWSAGGTTKIQRLAVESILSVRFVSLGTWTLWSNGFFGGTANPRDRRPYGFGRYSRHHREAGALRSCPVDPGWSGLRSSGLLVRSQLAEFTVVSGVGQRPAECGSNPPGACCRHTRSRLDSFTPGCKSRPDGGLEVRVK